jgi:hypothetical protein
MREVTMLLFCQNSVCKKLFFGLRGNFSVIPEMPEATRAWPHVGVWILDFGL